MENKNEELERTAGKENKDKDTLTYDQTTQSFVDIDDILYSNLKISKKINNLTKYGVTLEQIKTVYEMTGNAQGKSVDEIIEELEKVFDIFVNRINSDPNIGIVVDIDSGERNINLSIKKCEELGIDYEEYEVKNIQSKEVIMETIIAGIVENQQDIFLESPIESLSFSFEDWSSVFNFCVEPTEEDYQKAQKELGLSAEDEKK